MLLQINGATEAEDAYHRLASTYPELRQTSSNYYKHYLNETVNVTLPDAQLQQAYDWARVSMIQGMVNNPYLGKGLIAGYRTSGDTARPGFAWFLAATHSGLPSRSTRRTTSPIHVPHWIS